MAQITTTYLQPDTLVAVTIDIQLTQAEVRSILSELLIDLPKTAGRDAQRLYPHTYALALALQQAAALTTPAPKGGGTAPPTTTQVSL